MRMFKLFLLFFLLLSTYAEAKENQELEKVSLQLHWKYQFEFAGFIAAKEKGFYKDAGLDVTLKEYNFGVDIENDVITGKSEYGIYNSLSLLEYLRGKPLVLVSSYFKRAALVLVTSPDIKSPRDLIGKKIMASTKEDFILNYKPYFDAYGVDIDDVTLVPHTYRIDDFIEGKVDAMTAFVSNEVCKLDEKNARYNILDPSNENLYVLQLELITSKKELQEHPKRAEKFRAASLRGWQYALKHKEEISKIIYEKYSKRNSYAEVLKEARAVEKLILPYTYNIGSIDKNFLSKQMKLFQSEYHVGGDKKLDGFIYNEMQEKKYFSLNAQEKKYIKSAGKVKLCTEYGLFPLDGVEDGKFTGAMSDLYAILHAKTGLQFEVIASSSRADLKEKIDTGACDMLSIYAKGANTYKSLHATKSIVNTHLTLVSEIDKSFISNVKLLKGKHIITQFTVIKKYLENLYPFLDIEVVPQRKNQIQKLLNNSAYALVTLDEQADYIVDETGYGKLKINGFLVKDHPIPLSLGVQNNKKELYGIIEKALESISDDEIQDIMNSWRVTRYQRVVNYTLVLSVAGGMSLLLLIMLYYQRKQKNFNAKLEQLVNEKTRALREINEYLEETVAQKVQELIQKDEILTVQSKQAVMGEMISMIAHQWRQPLNTITLNISNLQIKQMMGLKLEDEVLSKSFDEISETISYLSETIDDFKTYFHPDKKSDEVNIEELLAKAVQFVIARAKSKNIEIRVSSSQVYMLNVYANELIQVLLNILNNAIDAYEESNNEQKYIQLHASMENEEVLTIEIKDEAGGIEKDIQAKLFEPYFSTKGKNGTGLGLYMSQMIIEKQFNGKLEVHSEENWTKFIITIRAVGV